MKISMKSNAFRAIFRKEWSSLWIYLLNISFFCFWWFGLDASQQKFAQISYLNTFVRYFFLFYLFGLFLGYQVISKDLNPSSQSFLRSLPVSRYFLYFGKWCFGFLALLFLVWGTLLFLIALSWKIEVYDLRFLVLLFSKTGVTVFFGWGLLVFLFSLRKYRITAIFFTFVIFGLAPSQNSYLKKLPTLDDLMSSFFSTERVQFPIQAMLFFLGLGLFFSLLPLFSSASSVKRFVDASPKEAFSIRPLYFWGVVLCSFLFHAAMDKASQDQIQIPKTNTLLQRKTVWIEYQDKEKKALAITLANQIEAFQKKIQVAQGWKNPSFFYVVLNQEKKIQGSKPTFLFYNHSTTDPKHPFLFWSMLAYQMLKVQYWNQINEHKQWFSKAWAWGESFHFLAEQMKVSTSVLWNQWQEAFPEQEPDLRWQWSQWTQMEHLSREKGTENVFQQSAFVSHCMQERWKWSQLELVNRQLFPPPFLPGIYYSWKDSQSSISRVFRNVLYVSPLELEAMLQKCFRRLQSPKKQKIVHKKVHFFSQKEGAFSFALKTIPLDKEVGKIRLLHQKVGYWDTRKNDKGKWKQMHREWAPRLQTLQWKGKLSYQKGDFVWIALEWRLAQQKEYKRIFFQKVVWK